MVDIKFERTSDTLHENVKKIIAENTNFKRDFLIQLSNEFLNAIRFVAPRDTGKYANSWGIQSISENSITIGTPLGKLAMILEYGTVAHPIFPKRKKVLRWEDASGEHFALYVRHPGTRPSPHIRPSLNVVEAKISEIAKNLVNKYFRVR